MTSPTATSGGCSAACRNGVLAVTAGFAFLVGTIIILNWTSSSRAAIDQDLIHYRAISYFAGQWPTPDLSDYPAPSAPLYYLIFSVWDSLFGNLTFLRLISACIGAASIATAGLIIADGKPFWIAASLTLPLASSTYLIYASAWLNPEALGWALVFILIGLAFFASPLSPRTALVSGVLWSALILTRQLHVWMAMPLITACLVGLRCGSDVVSFQNLRVGILRRWPSLAALALGALPGVVAFAALVALWDGLQPPMFQSEVETRVNGVPIRSNQGINLIAPAVILMLIGIYGSVALLATANLTDLRRNWRWGLGGAGVGALMNLPESTYNYGEGRFSGYYRLAPYFPDIWGRSLMIFALGTLGGIVLGYMLARLCAVERLHVLVVLTSFAAFSILNDVALQRYFEPLILFLIAWIASRVARDGDARRMVIMFGALAAFLAAVSVADLTGWTSAVD